MAEKRKIEIFSAGCPVCDETIQMVNALACPSCDVQVLNMHREVAPPKLSEDLRGRALTVKEVNYILSGPDKEKPEGARDYAILLTLLRTSLRSRKFAV